VRLDQTLDSPAATFDGSKTTEVLAMAGSTAPKGRLVVIARDGGEGPSHPILDQLDIGRSEGDVIIADDRFLSPRHARIVRRAATVFVRDLWSVNGIYRRVKPGESGEQKLQDQDLILLGQQVLRFEIVKEGEEGFGPAVQHGTLVFGTPVGPQLCSLGGARLVARSTDGVARDVHHLRKAETVLGREQGDVVFTDDPFLSRKHAVIRLRNPDGPNPTYTLGDIESSNGTFLRIRGEIEIQHGDELRMGQQLFRLDLSGKELVAPKKVEVQPAAEGS